ncbi:uncharacterized protein CC84DRAFT_297107 [Paraphaeosphaeria sporulosa]|uniref:Uncharacterized protein n=1 Tax=Paraphaeosphaeria sporulosa TaxID=1460663 RepID=A0A177BYB9_9PLEO|nr:uncharacterized protein CC84DRAFT_297107 [Paraphaeosphaeria sporulosa]OAG00325.1 hypothetical protein CC84DRAFT_297107 [Paraphaeosphaeria sporulosa]
MVEYICVLKRPEPLSVLQNCKDHSTSHADQQHCRTSQQHRVSVPTSAQEKPIRIAGRSLWPYSVSCLNYCESHFRSRLQLPFSVTITHVKLPNLRNRTPGFLNCATRIQYNAPWTWRIPTVCLMVTVEAEQQRSLLQLLASAVSLKKTHVERAARVYALACTNESIQGRSPSS